MNELAVYTCITNGKDSLKEFPQLEGVSYFCYSDSVTEPKDYNGWLVLPVVWEDSCPVMTAKWHKVNSHLLTHLKGFKKVIWIDGSMNLPMEKVSQIASECLTIGLMVHPHRSCAYEEAVVVKKYGLDTPAIIDKAVSILRTFNYPEGNGLHAGGLVVRNQESDKVREFNYLWWLLISQGSKRDQLSLDLTLWLMGLKPQEYPWGVVEVKGHLK
jgi:O-antigen biosynthesis protein